MGDKRFFKYIEDFLNNYGEEKTIIYDNYDRNLLIDKLLKIKKSLKKDKKRFVIAGTIAGTVTLAYAGLTFPKTITKNNYLYLMSLNSKDLKIYDEDKNIIESKIDITDNMYVVTTTCKLFDFYNSYIVNDIGEIQSCYIKKDNIDFSKKLDKILCPIEITDKSEIDIVSPLDGCWIRKEKKVDKNTDDAKLLDNGVYVIASYNSTTSKDNDYYWKNVIYVDIDNKKFFDGYMIDGYLINSNFDDVCGIELEVLEDLNVRDNASLSGNVIDRLKKEEKVLLVPNLPSKTCDGIDWFYIAYNNNDKINFGYCAATEYTISGDSIKYLKVNDDSFLYDTKYSKKKIDFSNYSEKMIGKLVDFKGTGASNLKLRKEPGIDSDILYYLENDTYVYTYESNLNNVILKDGYNWLKIYLVDGTEGYVAKEYLKDYICEQENKVAYKYSFKNNDVKGFFGVDINSTTDPSTFEKLITTGNVYTDDYPYMNVKRKIDFAIIKLGSTADGRGNFQIINKTEEEKENINSLTNVCEKNGMKYGMYYYSQATSIEEADSEVEAIIKLIDEIGLKSKNNMVLPLYIDIESIGFYNGEYDTRVKASACKNGRDYQTKILNYLMNELRKKTDFEICLYTDYNTLNSTINFNKLDEINKNDCWIVETSRTHTNNLVSNESVVYEYMRMRQTEINKNIFIDDTGDTIQIDFDIMNEDFYKKHTK